MARKNTFAELINNSIHISSEDKKRFYPMALAFQGKSKREFLINVQSDVYDLANNYPNFLLNDWIAFIKNPYIDSYIDSFAFSVRKQELREVVLAINSSIIRWSVDSGEDRNKLSASNISFLRNEWVKYNKRLEKLTGDDKIRYIFKQYNVEDSFKDEEDKSNSYILKLKNFRNGEIYGIIKINQEYTYDPKNKENYYIFKIGTNRANNEIKKQEWQDLKTILETRFFSIGELIEERV